MPQRIQPLSLRKTSIQNIVDNYSYWCVGQSFSDPDFISPFQDLCDDMVQELVVSISEERERWRDSQERETRRWRDSPERETGRWRDRSTDDIRCLFHQNLRHLDISRLRCPRVCIQDLGTRCQGLTHLNLRGRNEVQPGVLCELVSLLPKLVSLGLKETKTDKTVLIAIVENCPKLVDLNVVHCKGLRAEDVLILCNHDNEHPENSLQLNTFACNLWSGKNSVDIAVALLKSHQNLKSLGMCGLIGQALCQMYGMGYEIEKKVKETWILNLTDITIRGYCHSRTVDHELAILCSPYLTTLNLSIYDGNIVPVSAFSKLKYVKAFKCYISSRSVTLDSTFTCVVPILDIIGRTLTYLHLDDVDECLVHIGELCPNLQTLKIQLKSSGRKSSSKPIVGSHHFRQLQVLDLCDPYDKSHITDLIPAETLSMILENAFEIRRISFILIQNLTNNIISKAIEKHGFGFLRRAEFTQCHSITLKTGMMLLRPDNPLEHLVFDECRKIGGGDSLNEYAKLRQFNIDISISPIDMPIYLLQGF